MTEFLSDHGVIVALVCAAFAVAYGVVTTRSLLALSPGNATMQRLSAAVQEGASAYLRRQYTVIAGVGVVLFILLIFLQDIRVAIGFAIGGLASAAAGFIGMNVSVRSNARVAEAARGGIGPALDVAFRGGAGVGAHRHVHADEARTTRQQTADGEADGDLDVLDEDQGDEQDDADGGDRRVLAPQVGRSTLLDGGREPLHRLVAGRQREQRPRRHQAVRDCDRGAHQRDDDPVVG